MSEESSQYNSRFEDAVNSVVVGEKNIIYNYYYYREDVKPVDPAISANEYLPCPYRGLYNFYPKDSEFFFGREKFVEELFAKIQTCKFINILGASGSGKSSVVMAGLVPKLEKTGDWKFTYFRPDVVRTKGGSSIVDPFYTLAKALTPLYIPKRNETDQLAQASKLADYFRNGKVLLSDVILEIQNNYRDHRVLLIADQFEQLYTSCEEKIRCSFIDLLLDGIQSSISQTYTLVLVTTMRADFFQNAISYRRFADVLQSSNLILGPMNQQDLKAVIEKPANQMEVTFEVGLVERILNDVEAQPGNLALLEFALTELWNKRTDKQLTHKIYEEIKKVEGALTRHADEKYGKFSKEEKEKIRQIFIYLVRLVEGTQYVRRVANRTELGEENWKLVILLANRRLVVTNRNSEEGTCTKGEDTVEIIHEALIYHWYELRSWIDDSKNEMLQKQKIEESAFEWNENHKSSDYLLKGRKLNEAKKFHEEQNKKLRLTKLANEFIDKSIKHRRKNRLMIILGLFIVFAPTYLPLGIFIEKEVRIQRLRAIVEAGKEKKYPVETIKALESLVKAKANLSGANLSGANLSGANLSGANLSGANLSGADLSGANLSSANLISAKIRRTNLSFANLSHADLNGAKASRAVLKGANLRGTNFLDATLSGANLEDAIFDQDSNLKQAQLCGRVDKATGLRLSANLHGVKNLTLEQLKQANYWEKAHYDPSFRKKLGLPTEIKSCE